MMKQEYSAGVVVFFERESQREYLVLHYQWGHWDFPKGHIEGQETKQQTALRELREETGLSTKLLEGFQETCSYWYRLPDTKELSHKEVTFFVGRAVASKEVTLSFEHIGYAWLPFEQALERLTYDNAKHVLQKVESFLQGFPDLV